MKFEPIFDLVRGKYKAQIFETVEKKSAAENDMLKVTIHLWDNTGRKHVLSDFLFGFKLKNFCEAVGLDENYKEGELHPHQCTGKEMFVAVDHEEYTDKNGNKAKAIRVKKYLPMEVNVDAVSEDVPF